ncbi:MULTISPECIES: hypothetical protein [Bartonella]|nr:MULTISPECIES: hypothetical protein [Bartonella]
MVRFSREFFKQQKSRLLFVVIKNDEKPGLPISGLKELERV